MAKEKSKIMIGIIIGLVVAIALFMVGKMAYDSGYADGKGEGITKINNCLSQCSYRLNQTTFQYRQNCVDICATKGTTGNYYGDYYPPPFPF